MYVKLSSFRMSGEEGPSLMTTVGNFTEDNMTTVTTFLEAPTKEGTIKIIVLGAVMVAGVTGNILIMIALYRNRLKWKESFSFILNIAVCDLLICLISIPLLICTKVIPITSRLLELLCRFHAFISIYLNYYETVGVLLAALDRFIFVFFPLRYYSIFTAKFCNVVIIASNALCLIYCVILNSSFQAVYGVKCRMVDWHGKIAYSIGFISILIIASLTFILHSIVTLTACIQYQKGVKLDNVRRD